MSLPYAGIHDIQNANGWIIDTSAAVCLQIAEWTEGFLASPVTLPDRPKLRIAPSAYGHSEERNEFAEQLDPNNLQFWETMADAHPHITSAPFSGDSRQAVQDIIRASRRDGRSISRADAEGIFLAKQHGFVLVTGDNRQAEIAVHNAVTVVHKGIMLEYLAGICILPITQICHGLCRLISKSIPNSPCSLPDSYRVRLQEIYQQKCLDASASV